MAGLLLWVLGVVLGFIIGFVCGNEYGDGGRRS